MACADARAGIVETMDSDLFAPSVRHTRERDPFGAVEASGGNAGEKAPTEKQLAYARTLARSDDLPAEVIASRSACSAFIDERAGQKGRGAKKRGKKNGPGPLPEQIQYARRVAGPVSVPPSALEDTSACNAFIRERHRAQRKEALA